MMKSFKNILLIVLVGGTSGYFGAYLHDAGRSTYEQPALITSNHKPDSAPVQTPQFAGLSENVPAELNDAFC